ncbi:uncharacterized protein LOC100572557 isoform X2 [Acyrthosiphon pisum]|uniref:PARP catalytic domain-containing protein n=1 Tax=Acyrthosiphon pisum TaxID=7029 RepID=A0A8R2D3F6_ACYPI|nr:uncharacterized protein LOC100572557 isoform X2 [Acyrthosiphon pisum]|eukprot:XP_016658830.1 PREDICTED: uncharacterized protein LOC100572557 isoform X2 [Acyrthosiphon pisum]
MYSPHRSKDSQRSSKFTAHAAVQLQRRHNNSTSSHYDGGQLLENLGHKDSVQLERLVHETFPTMYGMYLLRKEEMRYGDKELILYHVTSMSRALESLTNGLDWRRTRRSKFGCGVLFSDDADYSNYYADHFTKEESCVIIVCAVLVNKTQQESGNRNLIVPTGGADTTLSSNDRVYVKYNDYDFYPLYLMYYRRTPEHLNKSKYFRNNSHNQWQQNNRVVQQQKLKQQQSLNSQRERDQAERLQQERLQQEREQAQRQQELRVEHQQELRVERHQAQKSLVACRRAAVQQEQHNNRVMHQQQQKKQQQELKAQRERDQTERLQQEQEQAQRQQEREQVQRQQEREQAQRQQEREQAQRQQELRVERQHAQKSLVACRRAAVQQEQHNNRVMHQQQQKKQQQELKAQRRRDQTERLQQEREQAQRQQERGQEWRESVCQGQEPHERRRLERDQEQLYSRKLTADGSICSVHRHRFCMTNTMYHSCSSIRKSSGASEFTRHAAPCYSERISPFMHHHIFTDPGRPLLNELNSNAYNDVEQLVKSTFPNCNIDQIRLVHAPQMNGMYMLRHEEMKLTLGQNVQEKLLFHVTTKSRAMESLKSGLDWRCTKRKKFGYGVFFSDDADYANYYADKRTTEKTRVIMICNVLVSETYVVPKKRNVNSFDQGVVPPSRVYVKYNDNDFYPLYFVYYQQRPEHMTKSKYFHVNTRQAMDRQDYLDDKGYHKGQNICYHGENDDYSNKLNGVDIYEYLDSKGIYDYDYDTPEEICYDDENDDYSNELRGDDLHDYLEAKGYYDRHKDDTFEQNTYDNDENDDIIN